jgi:hypothetical protein
MPTSAAPETRAGLALAGKLPTLLCWHGLGDYFPTQVLVDL